MKIVQAKNQITGIKPLGWLMNRRNQTVEVLEKPDSLSGEAVLPGFFLRLAIFWD